MRLILKEDPREWRKAVWMACLGLAVLSSLLLWRRILPLAGWITVWTLLACLAIVAAARPRWFRGYYRFTNRLGFQIVEVVGQIVLGLCFLLFLTPLGFALRLCGKDLLRLKRNQKQNSYWVPSRPTSSLDKMF